MTVDEAIADVKRYPTVKNDFFHRYAPLATAEILVAEIERLRLALAEATGDSLTNLLRYAENLDEVHGGMAAIHVEYVPYTAHWQAQASWSDGDTVTHVGNSPSQAMERLERNLKAAAEAAKEKR
jgi:hypothetical protein